MGKTYIADSFKTTEGIDLVTEALMKGGYVGTAESLKNLIVSSVTGVTGISITPADAPTGTGIASWVAVTPGTYTNFGGVVVTANSLAVISRSDTGVFSISQTALVLTDYAKTVDIPKPYSSKRSITLSGGSGFYDIDEPLQIGNYFLKLIGYSGIKFTEFYIKGIRADLTEVHLSATITAIGGTSNFTTTEVFSKIRIVVNKSGSETATIDYVFINTNEEALLNILTGSRITLKGGVNLPNINTANGTISFDTSSSFVINGTNYSLANTKYLNVSIKASSGSTNVIIFNKTTTNITAQVFNYVLKIDDVIVGSVKTNSGTTFTTYINSVFPFEITLNGLSSKNYADRLNALELVSHTADEIDVLSATSSSEYGLIKMVSGRNINLSAGVGNVISLVSEAVSGWKYAVVSCVANDVFTINGTGGNSPRLWGFLNSSNVLLSVANTSISASGLVLTAPSGATKLIINDSSNLKSFKGTDALSAKIDANITKTDTNTAKIDVVDELVGTKNVSLIAMTSNKNINLSAGVGNIANLTPENISGWKYAIVSCVANDVFLVSGTGGGNPRLWAFLDSNNRILTIANAYAVSSSLLLTAPSGAAKIVINDFSGLKSFKGIDYITPKVLALENRDFVVETPDDSFVATIKGLKFSNELQLPITDFKKAGDLMVHVSSFCIINDFVYVTYYANTITAEEDPTKHTARFVYCSLTDLNNKTFIDLGNIGDVIDGKTVTELYDIILLKKDDATIYLMWTVALNGEYYRVYKTFDVATKTLSTVLINTFTVNGTTNIFSRTGMASAFSSNNIKHKDLIGDIGIMQKITSRNESGTLYYYTGCYVGPFNCIIKSSDLINWIFVSQPSFSNNSQWENAVYVVGDKVYYFCRQYTNLSQYGFLAYFDLILGQWSNPVYIEDAQSRSDFIERNGNLYLIHAPKDRGHLSVMQINKTNLQKSFVVQTAKVPDYFYPFVQVYNNELYISYTASRQHIYLSKFTIDSISTDAILNKLRTLFSDLM